jgi:hypothetical protein
MVKNESTSAEARVADALKSIAQSLASIAESLHTIRRC